MSNEYDSEIARIVDLTEELDAAIAERDAALTLLRECIGYQQPGFVERVKVFLADKPRSPPCL